jgi:hypothetical protein
MIYIPGFIEIISGIQFIFGDEEHTDTGTYKEINLSHNSTFIKKRKLG